MVTTMASERCTTSGLTRRRFVGTMAASATVLGLRAGNASSSTSGAKQRGREVPRRIPTVCGRVAPGDLGRVLAHEHVICSSAEFKLAFGRKWLPREKVVDVAVARLKYVKERHHVGTVIDGTTPALGRDLDLLKEVSEKSGVHIVATTGFYHYPSLTIQTLDSRTLAEMFIDEVAEHGIGQLKCAVDAGGVQPHHRRAFECLARVQKATGLPLYVHTYAQEKNGLAILEAFKDYGIPSDRVVLGHAADTDDVAYLRELLKRGVRLSVDRIYATWFTGKAASLTALIKEGFGRQLLLSHDVTLAWDSNVHGRGRSVEKSWGHVHSFDNCLGIVFEKVLPILRANGISEAQIDTMLVANPAELWI